MKLYIKYMVSIRCKMVVKDIFNKLDIHYFTVSLGEAELAEEITEAQRGNLKGMLSKVGLELLDDKRAILIERIKNVIVQMIHYDEDQPRVKFSVYLSQQLNYDYTYLSNIFSETQGTTIEQYVILHKIEKAKELIIYDELNLTEIAWKLHYSSVSHLSTQFKKVTGLTPTFFKSLKRKRRNLLEDL